MEYRYIIVGAGSAECVLANRLSANPEDDVLLLESGGSDRHLNVRVPAARFWAARGVLPPSGRAPLSPFQHVSHGPEGTAVVHSELRVNGADGLRVVDASIMPTVIGGNTNAPTLMTAEKAADLILHQSPR